MPQAPTRRYEHSAASQIGRSSPFKVPVPAYPFHCGAEMAKGRDGGAVERVAAGAGLACYGAGCRRRRFSRWPALRRSRGAGV